MTEVIWSRHSIESVLLEPRSLAACIRAVAGDAAPADLEARITEALAAADSDTALNDKAIDQLQLGLLQGAPRNDAAVMETGQRAREMVRNDPATWQRGKDRARAVLGTLREHIALPTRNQFLTDILLLWKRVDIDSMPPGAIPQEVDRLLDLLTAR